MPDAVFARVRVLVEFHSIRMSGQEASCLGAQVGEFGTEPYQAVSRDIAVLAGDAPTLNTRLCAGEDVHFGPWATPGPSFANPKSPHLGEVSIP
jgi:hypothetical protein